MPIRHTVNDFLSRIVANKRAELEKRRTSLAEIKSRATAAAPPHDFTAALNNPDKLPVIAEIKHKSPSKGVLRTDFNPQALAESYVAAGAACLSVLSDTLYFGGADEHLAQARKAGAPILRKDFMLEEWQIYESRALGADAVLLIAALLSDIQMKKMAATATALDMAVLVEAHNEEELKAAIKLSGSLIGINNRNLHTFQTTLQTTLELLPLAKTANRTLISESGIKTAADVQRLQKAGVDAFLIGEACMRADDPGTALKDLFTQT